MNYQQSIIELKNLSKFGINMGLQRICELLHRLGNPQQRINHYIHIAGTNGKGSVAAISESILRAQGHRTGFFSSPHLYSYRERFRINSQPISERTLAYHFSNIIPIVRKIADEGFERPTEFEVSTALALCCFAEAGVDWAVMETGLGGAIDSTNIIDGEIAVITNVDWDHMEYLGNTIEEIATVKAGIIKKGASVICGVTDGVALDIIKRKAADQQASLSILGRELEFRIKSFDSVRQVIDITISNHHYSDLQLPLLGEHQAANATLAVAACELAGCGEQAIHQGLATVKWPARLEIISQQPLILLDGAHNCQGMDSLVAALSKLWPNKKIVALIGMLADKERERALDILLPYVEKVVVCPPPSARAGDWHRITAYCRNWGKQYVFEEADVKQACQLALKLLDDNDDSMLLAAGSLYLVAEIRKFLFNEGCNNDRLVL